MEVIVIQHKKEWVCTHFLLILFQGNNGFSRNERQEKIGLSRLVTVEIVTLFVVTTSEKTISIPPLKRNSHFGLNTIRRLMPNAVPYVFSHHITQSSCTPDQHKSWVTVGLTTRSPRGPFQKRERAKVKKCLLILACYIICCQPYTISYHKYTQLASD